MNEIYIGGAELSRDEIRAALHVLQDGRCAVCGAGGKLVVDHDHATGFARGLLCRGCNGREGNRTFYADIEAYLENPPAAGREWFWDLPDAWTADDTMAARQQGCTIVEYLPQHLERAAEREAALQELVIAYGRQGRLGRLEDYQ